MSNLRPMEIMRRGSTTFFNSSLFFPRDMREDVVTLYAFVRTADDFVDRIPQDAQGFYDFRKRYQAALLESGAPDDTISAFVDLSRRRAFEPEWVEAFLDAMEQDLWKKTYFSLSETEQYMAGSAEAVGMMMARIMSLKDESLHCARLLGKAFQYLNFVRDIREDLELGRVYIPAEEIARAGLGELSQGSAQDNPEAFASLIRAQIQRYRDWRSQAAEGYRFIPKRYLAPIKTAADVFDQTADVIENDPPVVWRQKVKPNRVYVLARGLCNAAAASLSRRDLARTPSET